MNDFKVISANYEFECELKRRLMIVIGQSGEGKTSLVEICNDWANGAFDISVELPEGIINIVELQSNVREQLINGRDTLFFVDDQEFAEDPLFFQKLNETLVNNNNFIVIIYRGDLDRWSHTIGTNIPLHVDSILEFKNDGIKHFCVPAYTWR